MWYSDFLCLITKHLQSRMVVIVMPLFCLYPGLHVAFNQDTLANNQVLYSIVCTCFAGLTGNTGSTGNSPLPLCITNSNCKPFRVLCTPLKMRCA